jgi:hypothetical protein
VIYLDRDDTTGARDENIGQRPAARPDFHNGVTQSGRECIDDAAENFRVGQKVLPVFLEDGRMSGPPTTPPRRCARDA